MTTLDEAIAVLVTESTDEDPEQAKAKAKKIAGAIYKDAKSIANVLIARGGGRANAATDEKHKAELEEKDEEIERLQGELKDATELAETMKGKAPEFEKKLAEQKTKYEGLLEKAKGELTVERDGRRADKVGAAVDRFKAAIEKQVSDGFVAKGLLAEYRDRFRAADNTVGYEVLQPGEKDEVFAPGEGERPEDLLVDAVIKDVPDKYIVVGDARPGPNAGGNRGGAPRAKTQAEIIAAKRASGQYG